MLVIPAIDIKNGKCVRLIQGDYAKEKIYSDNPLSVAKDFERQGAKMLHIVDLDAAKNPAKNNLGTVKKIVGSISIPVEVGGGIRTEKAIAVLIAIGADQVIIGTLALENRNILKKILSLHKNRISVAIDVKNGKLVKRGWFVETENDVEQTVKKLKRVDVKRFVYTDVLRDGMLTQPNFEMIKKIRKIMNGKFIVGGGISSIDQIKKLKSFGVDGVIIGKAIYEGKINIKEAINVS